MKSNLTTLHLNDLNGHMFNWELETRQLQSGILKGIFDFRDTEDISVVSTFFSHRIEQMGNSPEKHFTFSITADVNSCFKWRGYNISPNNIMIFPVSGELNAVTQPNFHVFIISVKIDFLEHLITINNLNKIKDRFNKYDVFEADPKILAQIRCYAQRFLNEPDVTYLKYKIPNLLLKTIASSENITPNKENTVKEYSLNTFLEYFKYSDFANINIKNFCSETKIAQRTLEYAFIEKYNLTPKAYINKVRLNQAFNEISINKNKKVLIKDIAYACDFNHMGQFCKDFYELFQIKPTQLFKNIT